MANVKHAMQSKSDQLNYVDVGEGSLIALVESVNVTNSDQQPVTVVFAGCNGKPYKPNKGMIRVLAGAWGEETDNWIGKTIKIVGDPTVTWAGEAIGGLVVGALSDIAKAGYTAYIQKNKRVRVKKTIPLLVADLPNVDIAKVAKECGWTVEQVLKSFNPPLTNLSQIDDPAACVAHLQSNKVT
jgi:hypothetical protein